MERGGGDGATATLPPPLRRAGCSVNCSSVFFVLFLYFTPNFGRIFVPQIDKRVTDVAIHVLGSIVAQGYNIKPRSRVHALIVLISTDARHPCHFSITVRWGLPT